MVDEEPPRKAWLAALLSLPAIGLGHVYAGRPLRGAVLWLASWLLAVGGLFAVLRIEVDRIPFFSWLVLDLAFVAVTAWDAARCARRSTRPFRWLALLRWSLGAIGLVAYGVLFMIVVTPWGPPGLVRIHDVVSGSMEPTLLLRDRVLVDRTAYARGEVPRRGDVVAYEVPGQAGPPGVMVKRVLGFAGERISFRDRVLHVNGVPHTEPWFPGGAPVSPDFEEVTVPLGSLYVVGDNRGASRDSRFPEHGPVPLALVKGRAAVIIGSPDVGRLGLRVR
jgi:signal peptidase I